MALRCGYIDVLQQFLEHSPSIAGTCFGNGDLQGGFVLMNSQNRRETIEFLVENASADINGIGRDGLAAVHVAAEINLVEQLYLLSVLKADMSADRFIQQAAVKITYCNGHTSNIGATLPAGIYVLKQNLSKIIQGGFRVPWVRYFMVTCNRKASDVERACEDAEDKLAGIWTRKIGLRTLQQLHSILETSLYNQIPTL
ncbi:hypothetical protein EYZ11_013398 [Aspergillus tanneri]|uniref:Uncharacterized protein n=1 Tax=Aspergillus tanneri TaxID=1220188 RepID=A0A4V3UMF9_9EURO|nr:hypothetical protein EYZ11_013398 [Aspergillus tanneri]